MSVKKEPKEEEFDDFLFCHLLANKTVDEKPELEKDWKTEMNSSPTIPDQYCLIPMDIKEEKKEEDVGLRQSGTGDSSATSKTSKYTSPKPISLQSPPYVYML